MTIPDTPFGARVRERLRDDPFVWLTTVGEDGTPQPNPVWFLWDGGDEVLVYNDNRARRLERFANGCRVSLAFQAGADGIRPAGDVGETDQPDLGPALARQHPHQIGIVHRIERMILQRTLVQRQRAHEQIALIDGTAGLGKCRRHQHDGIAGIGP